MVHYIVKVWEETLNYYTVEIDAENKDEAIELMENVDYGEPHSIETLDMGFSFDDEKETE